MADGILLEAAGIPAASVCTDSFTMPGAAMARVYGFPGYEFLTVPHPIASLDTDQIRELVSAVLPETVRILRGD